MSSYGKMQDSETTTQSDLALIPFLSAGTDVEADDALAGLMVEKIKPVIEKTLRIKMHASLIKNDFNPNNQDALELLGEINLLLIAEFRKLRSGSPKAIQNLNAYVVSVTINSYRQYLRTKYPRRRQLKNKLQYLLRHHPEFSLWEDDREWLCGIGAESDAAPFADLESLQTEIMELSNHHDLKAVPKVIELVRTCLRMAGSPILFNDLISLVARVQDIEDRKEMIEFEEESMMPGDLGRSESSVVSKIEQQEQLRRIWSEIHQMPVRHRLALLLNLKNKEGEGVLTLFPLLRIATIRQIAEALEFSPDEFGAIWAELPWEDTKIAEYMNLTRQQVINLRQSARNRLIRRAKS